MSDNMTIEQAQERILELQEQVNDLTAQRDTLSENNANLENRIEELRTQNQRYFNKLIAEEKDNNSDDNDGDDEIVSCEEFAKTLKI